MHSLVRLLEALGEDTSGYDLAEVQSFIELVDWDNIEVDKMWIDAWLLDLVQVDTSTFDPETYYNLLWTEFGIEVMAFTADEILGLLEGAGISTRGIKTSDINAILYATDWDTFELSIDVIDDFLAELGIDVRYIDQLSYHALLISLGLEMPTVTTTLVYDILT